jgi:hypothetical protein
MTPEFPGSSFLSAGAGKDKDKHSRLTSRRNHGPAPAIQPEIGGADSALWVGVHQTADECRGHVAGEIRATMRPHDARVAIMLQQSLEPATFPITIAGFGGTSSPGGILVRGQGAGKNSRSLGIRNRLARSWGREVIGLIGGRTLWQSTMTIVTATIVVTRSTT